MSVHAPPAAMTPAESPPGSAQDRDPAMVREVIRLQERAVDNQVRALEEHDDRTEQMLKIAISALAGGLAIGAFLAERLGGPALGLLVPLSAGGIANLIGIAYFLRSYGALVEEITVDVGPSPTWLADTPVRQRWDAPTLKEATVHGYSAYYRRNQTVVEFNERQRRGGTRWIGLAVALYASTSMTSIFVLVAPWLVMV